MDARGRPLPTTEHTSVFVDLFSGVVTYHVASV